MERRVKITKITKVPHRLEPWGMNGYTVRDFNDSKEAALFVHFNMDAAMPCWRRFKVIEGDLCVTD